MRDQPLIGTKEIAGYAQQLQDGFGGSALQLLRRGQLQRRCLQHLFATFAGRVLHDGIFVKPSQDLTAKVQQLEALQPREVCGSGSKPSE